MTGKAYEVTATPEGGWWALHVPELDVSGRARRLAKAEGAAQEIIAVALDTEAAAVEVSVRPVADPGVRQTLAEAEALSEEGQELVIRASRMRATAIREYMKDQGLTVREVASLLNMSPGRVQQIIKG